MSDAPSTRPASLSFAFNSLGAKRPPRPAKAPFTVAIFGDFTGRASRGAIETLDGRKGRAVDVDTFEKVLADLAPTLWLADIGEPSGTIEFKFESLDDFHPDQLIPKLPTLARLRALRPQLLAGATAAKAAAEVREILALPLPKPPRDVPAPAEHADESEAETIARLLGRSPAAAPAAAVTPRSAAEQLIRSAVAGSVVQNPTAQQQAVAAALDAVCTEQLRAVLGHPQFQALEAGWRALDQLVRVFDEGDNVQLRVFDISKDELAADLAGDDVTSSALYRLLYDAVGREAWAVSIGNYTFGESAYDVALAGKLTLVGAYLSTPLIAGGSPFLAGCAGLELEPEPRNWTATKGTELGTAWEDLRRRPEAAFLALALPRFLLRQPYGKGSDAIDTFAFEELPPVGGHRSYLWGNPAFLCARVLIESFKEDGWSLTPSPSGEVGEIPVHTRRLDGDVVVQPGAEAWLLDRTADVLKSLGLVPVLSIKGRDSVRVMPIDSVSFPSKPLALRLA
jgi:type VI secretion system ImpC/EvpB family protein/type VI secretion system ImpB/VipA family protein